MLFLRLRPASASAAAVLGQRQSQSRRRMCRTAIDPMMVEIMRQISDLRHTVAMLEHHVLEKAQESQPPKKLKDHYFQEEEQKP